MVNFSSFVLLATAVSAASIFKRDVAEILQNLSNIDAQTDALTAAITGWDASLLGALGIQSSVTNLESAINTATTEAQGEAQASSADSTTVLNYVSNTLNPDIVAALNALTARESDFAALSLTSLVLSDLETLRTDTNEFGTALVAIASSDTKAQATTLVANDDAAFASAIAAFS